MSLYSLSKRALILVLASMFFVSGTTGSDVLCDLVTDGGSYPVQAYVVDIRDKVIPK
jgi:hypothetical protein